MIDDLIKGLGPHPSSVESVPARIFTQCALVAYRRRDRAGTIGERQVAQEVAEAIEALAKRWGIVL